MALWLTYPQKDDGAPCAGCGQPLAAPTQPGVTWVCPDCGSTALRVFYSERRVCQVGTYADGPNDPEPWPSYTGDELVDRMRQDSERKQAVAHVRQQGHLPDLAYAACNTAHTSPQRSWNRRRCSAKDTVSFMC